MNYDWTDTAIGRCYVSASDDGVTSLKLLDTDQVSDRFPNKHTDKALDELIQYFDGELKEFSVTLHMVEGTPFMKQVWKYLLTIPYGQTVSYLDIARYLDNEKAVRAVGMANGKNPIPIIVPCHRVIGSNGSLVGYASGLDIKKHLLRIENPKNFGIQSSLF